MSSRAIYQSGPSLFKRLVRLVARTFYAGPCPPRPDGPLSRRKWEKVNTAGIAIVILDHLAQKEWVREEHLTQELRIAPKLLLRALRFLEQERILRHDSRKEGKRAQQKDLVILATKKETAGNVGEPEAPPKPLLQTYWAIDYPSFWDVLRVRLHLMRFKIKAEVENTSSVLDFECPQCGIRYTSLDFVTILNRQTGQMMCTECGVEVVEEFGNEGVTGQPKDRRQRREDMKAMLKQMDEELRLIIELVNQAKDIKPPDYGCLSDWAYEQTQKTKAKQAQNAQNGNEWDLTYEDLNGRSTPSEGPSDRAGKPEVKELPPWMARNPKIETKPVEKAKPAPKRKANAVLPPPIVHIPSVITEDRPADPAPALAYRSLISQSSKNKKIKIISPTYTVPPPQEAEDDGIEWEDGESIPCDEIQLDAGLFDEEAARLADLESDVRTNSGWTTVQK